MKEKPICMEQGVKLAKEVSWRFKSSNLLGITVCVLYFPYLYFIFLYEKTCSIHTKGSAQPTGNPWLKSIHSATAQSYSGAEGMDLWPVLKVPTVAAFLWSCDCNPDAQVLSYNYSVIVCHVTWFPFATFPTIFPQAKSMWKLPGKVACHPSKLLLLFLLLRSWLKTTSSYLHSSTCHSSYPLHCATLLNNPNILRLQWLLRMPS